MAQLLSSNDRYYYKQGLLAILKKLEEGSELYTFQFEHVYSYTFTGKANRPLLRKCLRTLEHDGLIHNIDLGTNIHKWRITQKGRSLLNYTKS